MYFKDYEVTKEMEEQRNIFFGFFMNFENKQVTIVTIFLDFSLFPLSQTEDYHPRLNPRYVVNKMHIANFLVHTSKALDSSTCYNTCKVPLLYISTHTYNKEAF